MKIRILLLIGLFVVAACTAEVADEPAATAVPPPVLTAVPPPVLPTPTVAIAENIEEATAVSPVPPPPTNEPAPAEPTDLSPTETAATAAPIEESIVVEYGRTAAGAYFQGAADAPVAFIDYSDFL